MKFVVALTVALWLNLLAQVHGDFYIEVVGNKPQEAAKADETGSCKSGKQADIPEMKGGLYSCSNAVTGPANKQQKVIKCKKVQPWQKLYVFYKANFFVVGNAQLNQNQVLNLDGLILTHPPEVMVVGFDPRHVDSPGLKPHPRCAEAGDVVSSMIFTSYLPEDDGQIQALTEFFCATDVADSFIKDQEQIARAKDAYLPVVRHMLEKCMSVHESTKGSARLTRSTTSKSLRSSLSTPFTYFKTKSRIGRSPSNGSTANSLGSPAMSIGSQDQDPQAAATNLERAQMEAVMKVMMNTLIDPCILQRYVESQEDESELHYTCKIYCQFLGKAAEVFGRLVALHCNYLIDGSCSKSTCMCAQKGTSIPIKMLFCDNSLRNSLTPISQCQ